MFEDFTDDEINELIDKGILVKRTFKSFAPIKGEKEFTRLIINEKHEDALYNYLEKIVKNCSTNSLELKISLIRNKFDLLCFDNESKREFIKSKLETINNNIDNYYLLCYNNRDAWQNLTLSYFKLKDYLEFIETNKIKKILLNDHIRDWIDIATDLELIKFIQKELIPTNPTKPKGFNTKFKPHQIESLFNQLKGNYIAENTNSDHFKAIFKDEFLPVGFIPIKKLKPFSNVLCAYFISELFQKENPTDYWSIAENCFDAKNLKQSLNNAIQFNPKSKPKGFEEIDKILKTIYTRLQ